LTDEPRPGVPRKATDDQSVDVMTRTLEGPPAQTTQWTTRGLADVAGLSKTTIGRIWQTFGLQAHRLDTFKLSADPQVVETVRDIVGLYLCPPDRAIVLSMDEKSQVQALDRTRPSCRCARASRPARPTTTFATAPLRSLPPWKSRREKSSASVIAVIGIRSFSNSLSAWTPRCRPIATCT
jgi:hypothetical protein